MNEKKGGMAMSNFVITIGREFGSNGKKIGEEVAKRLGIKCYDKELLSLAAKDSGFCEEILESNDEKPTSSFLYSLVMDTYSMNHYSTAPFLDMPLNQKVFLAQYEAIQKIAGRESCVIVGRCADYALHNHEKCLNVFIHADKDVRIAEVCKRMDISVNKAKDMIQKQDKQRASYYNYYSNKKWGAAESYNICLDSSLLGIDGTAKAIEQLVALKETVTDSMDNIKKLVEEIPYLQLPKEEYDPSEEEEDTLEHIETDHEIDDSLKINFKELLAEEHDGQIGMYMPEKTALEHQITGQMSIEEVLAEWEKTKYAAEVALEDAKQRRLESAKARALQEAEEIMGRLADIIPKLDAGVAPKDILQDQYIEGKPLENDRAAAMVANMNQILQEEIDRISTETADIDKQLAEAAGTAASMGEISGPGVNAAELAEEVSGMMQETEDVEISGQEQIPGSQPDEEIADLSAEETDEETVDLSTEEKAAEEVSDISEEKTSEADDFDIVTADTIDLGKVVTEQALAEAVEHITDTESATDDITQKELADNTAVEVTKEVLKKEDRVERVLPEITEPEDETGFEAVTSLGEELRGIFTYFVSIKGMEEQICQALTGAARHLITGKDASTGNMVIQGGSGSGKTVLATAMVKALQKETGKPKGKVGKIEASALNKKDVASLLKKISGGCLIIEKAGDISKETAVRLALLLKSDTSGLFVIMEDTHRGIEKALGRDEGFASRFSEKINIPIFTSDELVSFAKAYANELGYTIDEMGILALYNSISNIQKYDKATTLTEVKEIVDDAIHKSEKGGLRKAFSIITSRRYDDEDYVILREKDFGI